MIKYHLGCGKNYIPGYINVDFPSDHHNVNKNIKADIYDNILTMKYEKSDEIRLHHVFEHFGYSESLALLIKWTDSIIINGRLIIEVPDVKILAKILGKTSDQEVEFNIIRYLYGCQSSHWGYHINNWTEGMFRYILNELGYNIIFVGRNGDKNSKRPNISIIIEAKKQSNICISNMITISKNILKKYLNEKDGEVRNSLALYNIYIAKLEECFSEKK